MPKRSQQRRHSSRRRHDNDDDESTTRNRRSRQWCKVVELLAHSESVVDKSFLPRKFECGKQHVNKILVRRDAVRDILSNTQPPLRTKIYRMTKAMYALTKDREFGLCVRHRELGEICTPFDAEEDVSGGQSPANQQIMKSNKREAPFSFPTPIVDGEDPYEVLEQRYQMVYPGQPMDVKKLRDDVIEQIGNPSNMEQSLLPLCLSLLPMSLSAGNNTKKQSDDMPGSSSSNALDTRSPGSSTIAALTSSALNSSSCAAGDSSRDSNLTPPSCTTPTNNNNHAGFPLPLLSPPPISSRTITWYYCPFPCHKMFEKKQNLKQHVRQHLIKYIDMPINRCEGRIDPTTLPLCCWDHQSRFYMAEYFNDKEDLTRVTILSAKNPPHGVVNIDIVYFNYNHMSTFRQKVWKDFLGFCDGSITA